MAGTYHLKTIENKYIIRDKRKLIPTMIVFVAIYEKKKTVMLPLSVRTLILQSQDQSFLHQKIIK